MKKNSLIVLFTFLAVILAGCKFDLKADIYFQDVIDLPSLDEPLYSNATIAIDYAPDETEDQEKFQQLMKDTFRNVRDFREEEQGYSTYTVFSTDMLMLSGNDHTIDLIGSLAEDDILSIFVEYREEDAILYAVLNEDKYEEFKTFVNDEYYRDVTLEEASITVNLINDARETINIEFPAVYVNNTPHPYGTNITMERRDEVSVRFPDVMKDSLEYDYENDLEGFRIRAFGTVLTDTVSE